LIARGESSLAQEISQADSIIRNSGAGGLGAGTKFTGGRVDFDEPQLRAGILDDAAFDAEAANQGLVANNNPVLLANEPSLEPILITGGTVATSDTTVVDPANDLGILDPDTIFDQIGLENLEQTAAGEFSLLGDRVEVNKSEPRNWDDWRVRLSLAPDSNYLYKTDDPASAGILYPLIETDGIIFPYTPQINIQYNANYQNYEMTHSNYLGYFYKGSAVTNLNITATFTAQDTNEANYMLASLHFLRSATKMFYGKDAQRGMPPPLVYLTGLGEYNFNNHPCVVSLVNYNLPNDVDYIAAGIPPTLSANPYQNEVPQNSGHQNWSSEIRLKIAGLFPGARNGASAKPDNAPLQSPQNLDQLTKVYEGKTYVPVKIDINFTLIPIQTREQVSKEFSLREYANGKLLKKGFW
jgi:hypothetical protein